MPITLQTITPRIAEQFIQSIVTNRRPSKDRIKFLSKMIKDGNWKITTETMKFNKKGEMIDGQHRCLAIIEADIPVQCWIATGLSDDVREVIDTGKPRNASDLLFMAGEKSGTSLAGALRKFIQHKEGAFFVGNTGMKVSNIDIVMTLKEHPDIRIGLKWCGINNIKQLIQPSISIWLYYEFLIRSSELKVDRFFAKFATGKESEIGDPVLTLRNRLIQEKITGIRIGKRSRLTEMEIIVFCIKAWNAYIKSKPIKKLVWNREIESFPMIDGDND